MLVFVFCFFSQMSHIFTDPLFVLDDFPLATPFLELPKSVKSVLNDDWFILNQLECAGLPACWGEWEGEHNGKV